MRIVDSNSLLILFIVFPPSLFYRLGPTIAPNWKEPCPIVSLPHRQAVPKRAGVLFLRCEKEP